MLPPGMHAVELPRPVVEPELGRRRHRWITGPSGFLLFLCAFFPLTPLTIVAPHIYGLLLALAASAQTPRGLGRTLDTMRAITIVLFSLIALIALALLPVGLVAVTPALVVLAAIGFSGRSEYRAALTAIVIGGLGIVWFGLLLDHRVATLASSGLVAGGLLWLGELGYPRGRGTHEVHHVCRARAGRRRL